MIPMIHVLHNYGKGSNHNVSHYISHMMQIPKCNREHDKGIDDVEIIMENRAHVRGVHKN